MTLTLTRPGAEYMERKSQSDQRSSFARWLLESRAARGWSQDVLAANTDGATQGYISSLERGVRQPSRDIVKIIARSLYNGESEDDYSLFEARALEAAGYLPDAETPAALRDKASRIISEAYWNRPARDQEIILKILFTNERTGETLTIDDILRITGQDQNIEKDAE